MAVTQSAQGTVAQVPVLPRPIWEGSSLFHPAALAGLVEGRISF